MGRGCETHVGTITDCSLFAAVQRKVERGWLASKND